MQVNSIKSSPSFKAVPKGEMLITMLTQLKKEELVPIMDKMKSTYVGEKITARRFPRGYAVIDMYKDGIGTRTLISAEDKIEANQNFIIKKTAESAKKLYAALARAAERRSETQEKLDIILS